jgi:hypothetical protein
MARYSITVIGGGEQRVWHCKIDNEAAGVHHAGRRRGGRVAACGASAAAFGDAAHRLRMMTAFDSPIDHFPSDNVEGAIEHEDLLCGDGKKVTVDRLRNSEKVVTSLKL